MEFPEEHVHRQPVLTHPYVEPTRHWQTVDGETRDVVVDQRRGADEPLPMGAELAYQRDLSFDAAEPAAGAIDKLRAEVRRWREAGWPGTSNATRELLEYWSRQPGEGPVYSLFYAQREAIETVVFLTECGNGSHWMVRRLKELAVGWNQGLTRLAIRMATGTGKTTVMACLIAWYAVNRRREHRGDPRGLAQNVDRVVVICPGRTIRDRLAGLNPRAKRNLYDAWRLVPPKLRRRLGGFPVDIINWERLQPRAGLAYREIETKTGSGLLSRTRAVALAGGGDALAESESLGAMWARLLGRARVRPPERVVVLNDEGHHCWERKEGEKPGVWMEALHALREHGRYRLDQLVDLSATPIFINPQKTRVPAGTPALKGSTLVPWVVSEFALMESMEAGLVKIPQPPRGDNTGHESALRNLFEANGGQKLITTGGMALVRQGAEILYGDYVETFDLWSASDDPRVGHPVLIAVANNKVNARAIFEMLGGRKGSGGTLEPSAFPLLSNVPRAGADLSECGMRTILVLSKTNNPEAAEHEQIVGGALGLREVGSGPSRDASEDELRTVLQSVAQPGEPGAEVRCVVSVGMLTEGWDCQRVTHILGYRKFGSQLLCEQTMGRALRRRDYENVEPVARRDTGAVEDRFAAEYATVFGVPFARQTAYGQRSKPKRPDPKTEVRPVSDRVDTFRIWVPDFASYTMSAAGLGVVLDPDRVIETYPVDGQEEREIHWVRTAGPIGKVRILERDVNVRPGAGAWQLAAELVLLLGERLEREGEQEEAGRLRRGVLFSECLNTVYAWLAHERIAVLETDLGGDGMRDLARSAILDALDVEGRPAQKVGVSTDVRQASRSAGDWRPFLTGLRDVVAVKRSELNVAACHSGLEAAIARVLDSSDLVTAFVRNHGPERIEIPYKYKGGWAKYVPDFFVRCPGRDGKVPHVVLEGKGRPDERSEHKGWWTDNWWIPCANAAGAAHGQVWVRRELAPEGDVEAELRSAIGEATEA